MAEQAKGEPYIAVKHNPGYGWYVVRSGKPWWLYLHKDGTWNRSAMTVSDTRAGYFQTERAARAALAGFTGPEEI